MWVVAEQSKKKANTYVKNKHICFVQGKIGNFLGFLVILVKTNIKLKTQTSN